MKAVVLAAGKGVRLRPLTDKTPKALVEIAGKPLVEWVLESLKQAGVEETLIVVGHLGEKVKERFGQDFNGMALGYTEQKELDGNARAIALAKSFAGNSGFICAYCDVIVESSIFKELAEKSAKKEKSVFLEAVEESQEGFDAVVVGREVRDPWRFGVLKIEGERVLEVVEKPAIGEEPSNVINAGIYWFSPKIFSAIDKTEKSERGEFEITDSINILAKEGKVGLVRYKGKCIDIGTVEDLKAAEEILSPKK